MPHRDRRPRHRHRRRIRPPGPPALLRPRPSRPLPVPVTTLSRPCHDSVTSAVAWPCHVVPSRVHVAQRRHIPVSRAPVTWPVRRFSFVGFARAGLGLCRGRACCSRRASLARSEQNTLKSFYVFCSLRSRRASLARAGLHAPRRRSCRPRPPRPAHATSGRRLPTHPPSGRRVLRGGSIRRGTWSVTTQVTSEGHVPSLQSAGRRRRWPTQRSVAYPCRLHAAGRVHERIREWMPRRSTRGAVTRSVPSIA